MIVGIRPEDFEDVAFADERPPEIEVEVSVVEELGAETHVIFPVEATGRYRRSAGGSRRAEAGAKLLADDTRERFTARVDARTSAAPGACCGWP